MGSSPAERTILWLFSTSLSLIINTKNSIHRAQILITAPQTWTPIQQPLKLMQKIQRDQTRSLRHPESGFSNQVLVSQTVLDTLQLIFRAQINCLAVSFSNSCSQQMHGMSQISYPIFPFYFSPIAQISS